MRRLALAVIIGMAVVSWIGADGALAQSKSGDWCEANCRKLCQLTSRNPNACYQRIPCANYRGKACASEARVNARARTYCAQYPQQCP
jgi:hypothetical protein